MNNEFWFPLFLVLILILSVFLRLYGIESGLPNSYHTYTYNADEYGYHNILRNIDFKQGIFINRYYPGLCYVLFLGAFFKMLSLFKIIIITRSADFYRANIEELAKIYLYGRLLSVFFGVLSVYLIYLLAKKAYGKNVGLLSAFFFAILPSHVIYSRYMESDALLILFIIVVFFSCLQISRVSKFRWYLMAGIFTGLAISTKLSAAPLIFIILLAHLLGNFKKIKLISLIFNKELILSLIAALITLCFSTPTLIFNSSSYFHEIRQARVFYDSSQIFSLPPLKLITYPIFNQLYSSLGPFALILCGLGIFVAIFSRTKEDVILVAWVTVYYLFFLQGLGRAGASHTLPMVPFLAILGSRAICFDFGTFGLKKVLKPAAIILTVLTFFLTFIYTIALNKCFIAKNEREIASEWIEENIPENSSIGITRMPTAFKHPDIVFKDAVLSEKPKYKFFIVDTKDSYSPSNPMHRKIIYDRLKDKDTDPYEKLLPFAPDYIIDTNRKIEQIENQYELIKVFSRRPQVFGIDFDYQPRGGDLLYIIDICIFRRKVNI